MVTKNGRVYSSLATKTFENNDINGWGVMPRTITHIVIHGTATTSRDNVVNTFMVGSSREASAEYLVTDSEIIGFGGENFVHWHCGGTKSSTVSNYNAIGIEHINSSIGNVKDASTYLFSDKTLENGAKLVADICKRYNLKPDRSTIKLHREVMSTACPQTLNIDKYMQLVLKYYNGTATATTPTPKPAVAPQPAATSGFKEYPETGKFTVTVREGILFRNDSNLSSPVQGSYNYGESVNYDRVRVYTNGHVWISWVSASTGIRRWMPVRERKNGVSLQAWGTFI